MEPGLEKGTKLNLNNLKAPKKMRDSFLEPFTIINLVGKNAVEVKLTEEFSRKHPVFPRNRTPPEIVEVEDSPAPVKKIIKARKISLNGKDQRKYLLRLKNQTADKDKWLAEDAIPDGNLHLRRFSTFRKTEQPHK
ncbi:hypothetical protein O181_015180 [Austropuccinia psidii MF-1]|uniref:Uncharacterized protein n=1 Tax=Austropuccinia psidii MF-1 TaxID=1389203 RepID=A0A9Q3GQN7_9BASI|nr:hypothetical protein [Austropuccinia psidii MF-1]